MYILKNVKGQVSSRQTSTNDALDKFNSVGWRRHFKGNNVLEIQRMLPTCEVV